jgi:hypothetical protein
MTKAERAHELSARARSLTKAMEQDPLELGAIVYEISNDRDLLTELGFSSIKEWGEKTFGKAWKSVSNWAKVYSKLHVECNWPSDDILAIGTVKANLLARLPESEIRKPEWRQAAFGSSTADLKRKVKEFIDQSPDHKEGFCRVTFDAPKSFRDDQWKPTIAKGMAAEGTTEPYVVVEAALANYSIELENEDARDAAKGSGEDAASGTSGEREIDLPDPTEADEAED